MTESESELLIRNADPDFRRDTSPFQGLFLFADRKGAFVRRTPITEISENASVWLCRGTVTLSRSPTSTLFMQVLFIFFTKEIYVINVVQQRSIKTKATQCHSDGTLCRSACGQSDTGWRHQAYPSSTLTRGLR